MELIELEEEELVEKIDAVDLNALLENFESTYEDDVASIRINTLFMDTDGDTFHKLIVKKKRNCVLFIKKNGFIHGNDPDLDSADTDGFYLDDEKAMKLYSLLAHEVSKVESFCDDEPEVGDDYAYVTTKDGDDEWDSESDAMFATPTIFAIFKEFVDMVEEEYGDDYGVYETYRFLINSGSYLED